MAPFITGRHVATLPNDKNESCDARPYLKTCRMRYLTADQFNNYEKRLDDSKGFKMPSMLDEPRVQHIVRLQKHFTTARQVCMSDYLFVSM
jgi:hypothetical protein